MKVTVDKGTCIGCGFCEGNCPEVFRMGDDGLAESYQEATEENKATVEETIDGCPVGAISWVK